LLPDVPTVAEQGYAGFDVTEWMVAIAPSGTPQAVRDQLNAALTKVLQSTEMTEKFKSLGLEMERLTAAEADAFVAREIDKLGKIIRSANIKPE
jgi:tripartite-type tricarboxylate transporter receptor subunit TctC